MATVRAEKPRKNKTVLALPCSPAQHFCATTGSARALDWLTGRSRSCISLWPKKIQALGSTPRRSRWIRSRSNLGGLCEGGVTPYLRLPYRPNSHSPEKEKHKKMLVLFTTVWKFHGPPRQTMERAKGRVIWGLNTHFYKCLQNSCFL